jgi:hypothetical protein
MIFGKRDICKGKVKGGGSFRVVVGAEGVDFRGIEER